jgi:hypothetical protein
VSIAKFNPNTVVMTWGPILFVGFENGEFITAELAAPARYTRKQAFGRAIHTQSTDTGGTVTVRLQGDSPTILLLSAQIKLDLAPGGNVLFPLLVKDMSGFDVVVSPLARCITIPTLAFSSDDPPPREFVFQCEPLDLTHGGILSQNA